MNKHALLLSAAAVALLAGPAFADKTITTNDTNQHKTSADGNITIDTGGSVVVKIANPAIEIDSNNFVNLKVPGALVSNKDTANAIGIQLDATTAGTGPGDGTPGSAIALDNFGVIDLSGTGTNKIGILVKAIGGAGSIFNGDIELESGSTARVQGDSSVGLEIAQGATLNGNVTILGSLVAQSTSATSTTASNVVAMNILGDIFGDIDIQKGGLVEATGQGAKGLLISGHVMGSFTNAGSLLAIGTLTPATTGGNPEAESALVIAGSIDGGILNAGPSAGDPGATQATLSMQGTGRATVLIGPGVLGSTTNGTMTIGPFADNANPNFSFLNRGSITAQSIDPNRSEETIEFIGTVGANVDLTGGFFNSGSIAASAFGDGKQQPPSPFSATALFIGDYVNVNKGAVSSFALVNSNQSNLGTISASVSGSTGGTATAILIGPNATLDSIDNSGAIAATASTTDTAIGTLNAFAIFDRSGTLATINNSGTISATVTTPLDNDGQIAVAVNLLNNTNDVTFTDSGTVTGDIRFGIGNDVLVVNGTPGGAAATVNGDIAFGGTPDPDDPSNFDTLTIGTNNSAGSVSGAVTETGGGRVKVTIGNQGILTLRNTDKSLFATDLSVANSGVLNLSLSNGFNQSAKPTNPALVTAHNVTLSQGSVLNVSFGSFISTPGGKPAQFTLFDADNSITLANPSAIKASIVNTIPFLFLGTVCNYNTTGMFANDPGCGPGPSTPALVLNLAPKTIGPDPDTQIDLKGNAAKLFDQVNAALVEDDQLGAAIVTDVVDQPTAQKAYSSFVPDVSGSSRAVAISITDQATGPVGARQRALRMYAGQPGGATLWGQEFVERLNSSRGNVDAFRATGFGFALGVDSGDPRNGRYGTALTFFSGDQNNKGPNFTKTTNEWYMLSGYTDWRGKGFFLDSQLSGGYGRLNGKRFLRLDDPNNVDANGKPLVFKRTARSKRNALLIAGGLSTGAILTYGSTVITPQLSVDGLTMREEGYTEEGGGAAAGGDGFDLKVQPYYASSVRGYFGTSLREDLNLGDFFIQPELRAGYRYDFLSDPVKLRAAFKSLADTPDNRFTLTGPGQRQGNVVGGASIAITTGAWSLGVNYDYLRSQNGAISQFGTVTLVGRI